MQPDRELAALLDRFAEMRLLVLGDAILDRYWWGDCDRISPEAPVPIVRRRKSSARPGGAANTAANLAALGASVSLAGVVGADQAASELRELLRSFGIEACLFEDRARPTTTKTRVMAHQQQVVRVDEEDTAPVSEALTRQVLELVEGSPFDAIVVSDYAKGFVTPPLLAGIVASGNRVFIDPKGADYKRYLGCFLLKPNRVELSLLTHMPVRNHEEALGAGRALASSMHNTIVLVTEGGDGMTAFAEGCIEHAAPVPKQVFDVTGAGDTVLATAALAMCAGAELPDAMELASRAASIAVSVTGTSVVSRAELAAELEKATLEKRGAHSSD
ncbi:MAG: bifunctional heptose 7-phosphate kinase/heptose 1-phosphate adenyltransferase [Bryobacteraceae bacterium]